MSQLKNTRLVAAAPLYRSQAFGPVAQADFLNSVVAFVSQLSPECWLQELKAIELELGRSPSRVRWGPREIDLDLLVYGERVLQTSELCLPHPGIPEREFVLYPLRDIAADLRVGELGTVRELAARVAPRGIAQVRP